MARETYCACDAIHNGWWRYMHPAGAVSLHARAGEYCRVSTAEQANGAKPWQGFAERGRNPSRDRLDLGR